MKCVCESVIVQQCTNCTHIPPSAQTCYGSLRSKTVVVRRSKFKMGPNKIWIKWLIWSILGGKKIVYMLKMRGVRNETQQDLNKMVDKVKFGGGAKSSSRCRKWGQNRGAYLLTLKEGVPPPGVECTICAFLCDIGSFSFNDWFRFNSLDLDGPFNLAWNLKF